MLGINFTLFSGPVSLSIGLEEREPGNKLNNEPRDERKRQNIFV